MCFISGVHLWLLSNQKQRRRSYVYRGCVRTTTLKIQRQLQLHAQSCLGRLNLSRGSVFQCHSFVRFSIR